MFGYDQGGVMVNKTGVTVMVMMIFFLCVSINLKDIYAEDMIRYQVIGGNTLVISGTGQVNSVLGFDEKIDRSQIKKLIIGEGITKISALHTDLLHLKKVILPNTLVEIGDGAFFCNEYLEQIIFGKNLRRVGENAFVGCEKLSEVAFPDSVSEIGQIGA